jgi:hypothetical protein
MVNSLQQNLQQSLVETEDRIELARSYFNEIATLYNTRTASFPERYVAAVAGMKQQALLCDDFNQNANRLR